MMNTRQQEKQRSVKYMDSFKQENIIVKTYIVENLLGYFVETTKGFKKLDEENDAEEIIKMKKNAFEAWSIMVFMKVSVQEKIWGINKLFLHLLRD